MGAPAAHHRAPSGAAPPPRAAAHPPLARPAPSRRRPRRPPSRPAPPARSAAAAAAADGGDGAAPASGLSLFEQRERDIGVQLDDLKRAAAAAQEAALAAARAAAAGGGADAGAAGDAAAAAALRGRLEAAVAAMQEGLVERDTEVRLLLLAALAGEHILFVGPPGTAKSELGRRLGRLCGGAFFERLLTRFSVPEELFGPLSMRALEEDRYVRQTEGYLPTAAVAFVDEVFKANSAILNALLTLLNERLFDNGSARRRVPLLCLVGASNELPESEELDALYDRFLVRRAVGQVSPAGLLALLGGAAGGDTLTSDDDDGGAGGGGGAPRAAPLLSADDFERTRARAVAAVEVPPDVLNLLVDLRAFLQERCEPPVYVSDRRLVKATALLQVAAYTCGRRRVSRYDCLLLQHVLWQRPGEADRIAEWLLAALAADDGLTQMQYLLAGMFGRACRALGDAGAVAGLAAEVGALRGALVERLAAALAAGGGGPDGDGFAAVAGNMWLGGEAAAAAAALAPKLDKTRGELERLLFEVVTLEEALGRGGLEPVLLAELMPRHWADWVRNASEADVRTQGLRPLAPPPPPQQQQQPPPPPPPAGPSF